MEQDESSTLSRLMAFMDQLLRGLEALGMPEE